MSSREEKLEVYCRSGGESSAVRNKYRDDYSSDDNHDESRLTDERTTTKRKVNHKTRQVETRVSRQLLVRGGEVIADSGPQVVTRIKEDNRVEESEKEKTPKRRGGLEALENAPEVERAHGRVLGEKKEIQRVTREVREENMQYHDERFRELTGKDVHRKALQAPHELITINDEDSRGPPRGKMVHYSNKGKTYQDTDEILEVAKMASDGSITKERKHTKFHEESVEDEKPDEKGEAEALRAKPVAERSSRRYVDYVNDFDQPEAGAIQHYSDGSDAGSPAARRKQNYASQSSRRRHHDDEAFPRFQLDPLLNSLRDEDFKPTATTQRYREHKPMHTTSSRRRDSSSSSERHTARSPAPTTTRVEIPEEYRVNKQRATGSTLSHKSNRSSRAREHAATQARLTDEEVSRVTSRPSSPVMEAHEKTTRYLQRQSTPNSSRRYFYGDQEGGKGKAKGTGTGTGKGTSDKTQVSMRQRKNSTTSVSSSSLSSIEQLKRRNREGATSRDSGFRSPAHFRSDESKGGEIYSVSRKHKQDASRIASPTPSAGQRSVKTTTTTMSAGLADRPLSRADKSAAMRNSDKFFTFSRQHDNRRLVTSHNSARKQRQRMPTMTTNTDTSDQELPPTTTTNDHISKPFDTLSISSLQSPAATKIQVPYRRVIEIEREQPTMMAINHQQRQDSRNGKVEKSSSEMSFQEDIESLSKRLASISDRKGEEGDKGERKHFDYKTIVANVEQAKPKTIVGAYNVHHMEQNSPFYSQQIVVVNGNNDNQLATKTIISNNNNNNEANFILDDFAKYRAMPALVDLQSLQSTSESDRRTINNNNNNGEEDDRMSQISSVSLQSARTYNIRKLADHKQHEEQQETNQRQEVEEEATFDENGTTGKPAAWIFDPRDNSTTAIVPPPRPETPKIDSKTEELQQSRGGRSYYLELVDPEGKPESMKRQRPGSMDSLYSRWTSQGALNNHNNNPLVTPYRPLAAANLRQNSSTIKPSASQQRLAASNRDKFMYKSTNNLQQQQQQQQQLPRKQLPFSGPPPSLGDRSKSSSCLLSVTKPSKYSIYGGFKKPGESNKPVPRLSYSRAIGPRSKNRADNQPKVPSRYLKMR